MPLEKKKNSSILFMPTGGNRGSGDDSQCGKCPLDLFAGAMLMLVLQYSRQRKTLGSCGPEDTIHWLSHEGSKGRELKRMFPAECTAPGWAEVGPVDSGRLEFPQFHRNRSLMIPCFFLYSTVVFLSLALEKNFPE